MLFIPVRPPPVPKLVVPDPKPEKPPVLVEPKPVVLVDPKRPPGLAWLLKREPLPAVLPNPKVWAGAVAVVEPNPNEDLF